VCIVQFCDADMLVVNLVDRKASVEWVQILDRYSDGALLSLLIETKSDAVHFPISY
jgi:hypothetical protein